MDVANWIDVDLKRSVGGLVLKVKTDPRVEEFIKKTCNGRTDDLVGYGNRWIANEPEGIKVYRFNGEMEGSLTYRLGAVGEDLLYGGQINLSFLQFAGISNGIKFTIAHPFTRTYVEALPKKFLFGSRDFLYDYLVPIHVILSVTEEVK